MSAAGTELPHGFEVLQPFVANWAIEGANDRLQRRLTSSCADREAFFTAVQGLLPAALTQLDTKPLSEFDATEKRLMNLLLTFAHVALAVETQGSDEPLHAEGARHIRITRAASDR